MIPSLLVKLSVSGGYVNGLYQQSVMNKNLQKAIETIKRVPYCKGAYMI